MIDFQDLADVKDEPIAAVKALIEAASFLETALCKFIESNPETVKALFVDDEIFLMHLSSAVISKWGHDLGVLERSSNHIRSNTLKQIIWNLRQEGVKRTTSINL